MWYYQLSLLSVLSTKYSHFSQHPYLHNHLIQIRHHPHHKRPSAPKLNNHLVLDQTQYLLHRHLRSNTIITIICFYPRSNTESLPNHTLRFFSCTINPFSGIKNLSNIGIFTTNICGMKVGTDREAHKYQTVINSNSDMIILIDHHLDQQKMKSLARKHQQLLSKFTIYGTPSLKHGILVLVKMLRLQNHQCQKLMGR